jgi:predicted DNA-binding transcriptional regulator AlpA
MDNNRIVVITEDALQQLINESFRTQFSLLEQFIKDLMPEKKPVSERMYTKDVADYLGVSRQTVHAYRKDGTLSKPHYTERNRAYWLKEEIKAHLKSNGSGYKFDL